MHGESRELSLVLKNDLDELAPLAGAIDDFADGNEVSDKERFELQLCLEEVFTNIVSYGVVDIDEHEIRVDFRLDAVSGVLRVSIVDDGVEFDPLSDSTGPSLNAPLEDRPIGGLGIHLVRQYVDELEYDRRGGCNHLTLIKKFSSEASLD